MPLCEQLYNIIRNSNIKTVFQPIISLRDGTILGHEALSRGPENTIFHNPEMMFTVAEKCGASWDLELLCRTKALESSVVQKATAKLFLNVNPNIMYDVKFKHGFTREYLTKYNISPNRIIFEITEKNAVNDMAGFKKTIENYKEQNYQIAIDDAGAGYSGLNMISDIQPHFIKLDMNLIRDIDKNRFKRYLVKSIYEYSKLSDTYLIAEGIETYEELAVLVDIGVHYGQGYLIQKPNEQILSINSEFLERLCELNNIKNISCSNRLSNIFIDNLCRHNVTANPNCIARDVHNMFIVNPSLPGVCVIEDSEVIGIVTKSMSHIKMSGQYGYTLNSNKPISTIMEDNFLSVDYQTPVDVVSKLAMARPHDNLYDFVIVTKGGKYLGVVTVKDLLEKTIEMEIVNAKHQNPLSGLPGNLVIEQYLEHCILSSREYCVLYFDIDNFKAYNDVYGFESGDDVIKFFSNVLTENIPKGEFVGHIGGDDFIAIISPHNVDEICENIIASFDNNIKKYYNKEDLTKGYIETKNRHGLDERFPIISLSIAGVTNTTREFTDKYILSEYIGMIKKRCKQIPCSVHIIE